VGDVLEFPGVIAPSDDCRLVCVPGQRAWHTHLCPTCGSSWTHIAPTPMTQAKNKEIHTCTKCGTFVWTFVPLEPADDIPSWLWGIGGLVVGVAVVTLLDRG